MYALFHSAALAVNSLTPPIVGPFFHAFPQARTPSVQPCRSNRPNCGNAVRAQAWRDIAEGSCRIQRPSPCALSFFHQVSWLRLRSTQQFVGDLQAILPTLSVVSVPLSSKTPSKASLMPVVPEKRKKQLEKTAGRVSSRLPPHPGEAAQSATIIHESWRFLYGSSPGGFELASARPATLPAASASSLAPS